MTPANPAEAEAGAVARTHEWFERHSGWAPPDPETLTDWLADGGARAPDECWVHPPEGTCPHGLATWPTILAALADEDRAAGRTSTIRVSPT